MAPDPIKKFPFADRVCGRAVEAVLVAVVAAAPWGLGGTHRFAVVGIYCGVGVILLLWACRVVLSRTLLYKSDAALWALAGLTLLTGLQLIPLPASLLRLASPNTFAANVRLRPAISERLPGEDGPAAARPTAVPLSLSPPDTREFFTPLFAVTLLYAAARANLAGPGPLTRLAWVCVVNGALICLLGIAQRMSSPPGVIYWSVPTDGRVFGPFVNRNHLPYYANVCLGLGCALLACRFRGGAADVLHRPANLWLLLLVGVIAAGVVFSQSRGGVFAAAAAAAGCGLVWYRHARRAAGLGWLPWAAAAAALAGAWIGWGPLTARLGEVDEGHLTHDTRVELWMDGLKIFFDYPVFGAGGGTYNWVEPAARTSTGVESVSVGSAHNEYIEALAEGGVARLALTLLLVIAPVILVARRHRRVAGRADAPLLLGGLFGLLAVSLHSFVDFGVHLPAVAVLAAALLACLMTAADRRETDGLKPSPLSAGLFAASLAVAGALLVWDAWTASRAERLREATAGFSAHARPRPGQAERAIRLMEAATAARPGNALYRHELGQAHLALALTHPGGSEERTRSLGDALRHWRAARDLSPVMAPTHARLGRFRDLFAEADPATAYFERARSLLPSDPEMAYYCGRARWVDGDAAGACADWKASLAISGQFLQDILFLARPRLGPDEILRDVMPERPDVIFTASEVLFSSNEAAARAAYLDKALSLLVTREALKSAADWELEARVLYALKRPDEAVAAYRRAVGLAPRKTQWRFAYAKLLRQTGALTDARRELETVLAQDPNDRPARDQLEFVRRDIELDSRSRD